MGVTKCVLAFDSLCKAQTGVTECLLAFNSLCRARTGVRERLLAFNSLWTSLFTVTSNVYTIVSWKRAHGRYTLLCDQTRGWADICNIAAFYHEKAPMLPKHLPPPINCWQLWSSELPVETRCLSLPALYAYHEAMNQSARNRVQQPTELRVLFLEC